MEHLDHQLIFQARRLTNGSNVHYVTGLIYDYELAVELHNRQWPRFETYPRRYERRLREYVREVQLRDMVALKACHTPSDVDISRN